MVDSDEGTLQVEVGDRIVALMDIVCSNHGSPLVVQACLYTSYLVDSLLLPLGHFGVVMVSLGVACDFLC